MIQLIKLHPILDLIPCALFGSAVVPNEGDVEDWASSGGVLDLELYLKVSFVG